MLRALFREIVLIDNDMKRAAAEAQDIADANALARPARIWAGDYADAAAETIAVLTDGAATHGPETRPSAAAPRAGLRSDQRCVGDECGSMSSDRGVRCY